MKRLSLSGIVLTAAVALGFPVVARAAARPSLAIASPASGAVIHGTSLTVQFRVRNFTLIPVGGKAPKHVAASAGHIQTRLDALPINPATDLIASTVHTWQHVPAGHHVLTVWLANTMNVPIPGVTPVKLAFTIRPPASVRPLPAHHATSPGVGAAPRTGGAEVGSTPQLNHNLMLAALLALLGGIMLFTVRRLTFGVVGPHAGSQSSVTLDHQSSGVTADNLGIASRAINPTDSHQSVGSNLTPDVAAGYDVISSAGNAGPTPVVRVPEDSGPKLLAEQPPADPESTQKLASIAGNDSMAELLQAARRWPELVQDLAQRVAHGDEERRRLQERVVALEQAAQDAQRLRTGLYETGANPLNGDDLSALRYVADELVRDPDHIVTLGALSQHATRVHQLVEEYSRLHEVLYGRPER